MQRYLLILAVLALVSCGDQSRDLENYGNLSTTPGGIALVDPAEHRGGWGRRDCLMCHNAVLNIHKNPGSVLNASELLRVIQEGGESAYCLNCHGPNGL